MLASIQGFSKNGLKKAVTVDKSSGLLAVKGNANSTVANDVSKGNNMTSSGDGLMAALQNKLSNKSASSVVSPKFSTPSGINILFILLYV